MLDRITAMDGVVFYRSALLARAGVPHGFSTRIGGVSAGPFNTLNLGNPNGCSIQDDRSNIATNYVRLHAAIGAADRQRLYVHQVHGDRVESAGPGEPFDCNLKADAIVCTDVSRVAAVRTADCVPVLLATADGGAVAAVHAGWRGVIAGVLLRAVQALQQSLGARPPLLAAIGPAISFDAFEVGPEVATEFNQAFGGDAAALMKPSRNNGKAMLDLRGALRLQLRSAGCDEQSIQTSDRCTMRDDAEFFSHRRENGVTGRMAAMIGVGSALAEGR